MDQKKLFGWVILIGSALFLFYSLNMDTTVAYTHKNYETGNEEIGRVNNLGLMDDRRNYLILSAIGCLIGVVLIAISKSEPKDDTNEPKIEEKNRQLNQNSSQDQQKISEQQSTQPTDKDQASLIEELATLTKLKEEGLITENEFQQLKEKILSRLG